MPVRPEDRASGPPRENILVVKLYAIGDVIMALPGIEFLRDRFPGSGLTLLTGSTSAPLARLAAPVDSVIEVPESVLTRPLSRFRLLPLVARLRRERFSRAFLLHRVLPLRLLLLASGIPSRTGQGTARAGLTSVVGFESGVPEHDAERYARLFGWTGDSTLSMPSPRLTEGLVSTAESLLSGLEAPVAVAPGGGRSTIRDLGSKRWPAEGFSGILDRLDSAGADTVLLGSARDREGLDGLTGRLPASTLDLMGRTSVAEALAVLSRCRMLVANDSALMHMAGLVSTPTVSVFGPTDPGRVGVFPPSPMHRAVVPSGVDCRPCHPSDDWRMEKCVTGECMSAVTVDAVWNQVASILESGGPDR
jgi:lipopolysaccharide heptosyltransferase II